MAKEYEVNGTVYEFPDEYSDTQVQGILTKQGIIKDETPSAVSRFGSGAWSMLNPMPALGMLMHPSTAFQPAPPEGATATTAIEKLRGILGGTPGHIPVAPDISGAPVFGPLSQGDYATALGQAATMMIAPKVIDVTAGKVLPAVPDVARGATKAAVKEVPELLRKTDIIHPFRMVPDVYEAGKNVVKGGKQGLADYRYRQMLKEPIAPIWEGQGVTGTPIPPADVTIGPMPAPDLPSGRGFGPQPPIPLKSRTPIWEGQGLTGSPMPPGDAPVSPSSAPKLPSGRAPWPSEQFSTTPPPNPPAGAAAPAAAPATPTVNVDVSHLPHISQEALDFAANHASPKNALNKANNISKFLASQNWTPENLPMEVTPENIKDLNALVKEANVANGTNHSLFDLSKPKDANASLKLLRMVLRDTLANPQQ